MDYIEDARNATKKFRAVQAAYRAGEIDDTAYLAGRREYEEAEKAFDEAEKASN